MSDRPFYGVIYLVKNHGNGKCYVGQTIRTLKKRWSRHNRDRGGILGKALNKWGVECFSIVKIDEAVTREELDQKEIFWIDKHNTLAPLGYNSTTGGGGLNGWSHSEENRAAIRAAKLTNPMSDEGKESLRKAMTGRFISETTRQRISIANKGRKQVFTEEHKENLRRAALGRPGCFVGKKHTPETKLKMSISQKGRIVTQEAREKLRAANQGKKASDAARAKMSEAQLLRNARNRMGALYL